MRTCWFGCACGILLTVAGCLLPPALIAQSQASRQAGSLGPPQQAASASSAQPTSPISKEQQHRQAEREVKQEEHQRLLRVAPNFETSYDQNAAPLSPAQKLELNFRTAFDPFTFVAAGLDAAISQGEDEFPEYGQGAAGYGKRFGASYADTFDGDLWGSAILPILFREDPRYFRRGTGSVMQRVLYSAAMTVWCRNDNGTWGPNYANVAGNFVAGGISNLYYPRSDRGLPLTVERALTVLAEGTIGSEFVEFWPDLSARLFHRRPRIPPSATQTPPHAPRPVRQPPDPAPPESASAGRR